MEIKKPTPGRIVHFYHEDSIEGTNGAEFLPAIVLQVFGTLIANIQVFVPDSTPITIWSANHKTEKQEGTKGYWVYPEY